MSCQEQLADFKKKCAELAEQEKHNKDLLLENANLKKLLAKVQSEMREVKEVQ